MNGKSLFFSAAALFLLASCSHKLRISPDKPSLAATDFALDSLPDSEINIPIQINLKPVYALAEKQVDTLFTSPNYPDGWVQSGCDTRYKYVFRRSPLQMKAAGTSLDLGFTGYYKIIGSTRVCVAGAAVSPWTPPCKCGFSEPERRVNVSFSNSVSIQPDFKIKLNVRRNEPQALDKCEVCFWGQNITKEVLNGLKAELDAAKAALDKNYGTVDLKPQFQQLWNQLSQSYNIYSMGWLQINPQRIRVNQLYAKNDSLYVNLGLSARPAVTLEKPAGKSLPIPNMANPSKAQGFSIFVDAQLNYDSLSNIVNRYVVNKEFDFNKGPVKKKFIIKECRLSGSGNERMIIRVNFAGTDNGTVYLTGKPVYDKDKHILELQQIDFDIKSKDALLKTADWLFSRKIITEISRYTRFDLNTYIDSAKTSISQQLNHEWIKGVSSSGRIDDIRLIGIYPLSQALVIRSNCTGNLSVKVASVDFSL
ncbi:MAG: DUF4403 family protein [Chitinophagaceae bacterium]